MAHNTTDSGGAPVSYTNLDKLPAYNRLRILAAERSAAFDHTHIAECDVPFIEGLRYNYAARMLISSERDALRELAVQTECIKKYRLLLNGERMNTSENRMVLHHRLRGKLNDRPIIDTDNRDCGAFYDQQYAALAEFAGAVRSGKVRAPDNSPYRAVVQIGIGGSDLGPRALYLALRQWATAGTGAGAVKPLEAHFISNVDADDAAEVLGAIDPHRTLFIVVSKSGTTIETLSNQQMVTRWLTEQAGINNPKEQIVVVTAESSPLAADPGYCAHFFIDDHIGGRYSSCGAVGLLVLMLAYGVIAVRDFLDGAHAADKVALDPEPLRNPPLLDALCGTYERTFCGYPAYALLPYSQNLIRFPAHIQQLDMESNGKSVNRNGDPVPYPTGALTFGEPGTNGQHSFYQLLHQGTTIVPAIFIAFSKPASNLAGSPSTPPPPSADQESVGALQERAHGLLLANAAAQIVAFARGAENRSDRNKSFAGKRPSALLYGTALTPYTLGALLSFFENRVMFQGFIWNINSFDQEGVQLGKRLANQLMAGEKDPALQEYAALLSGNK